MLISSSNQPSRSSQKIRLSADLIECLLAGDMNKSQSIIQESFILKLTPIEIYTSIIAVSLNKIGDMWHEGAISIAHEHLASETAMKLIDLVAEKSPHLSPNGLTAVVACVQGEYHTMGAKLFSKLLEIDGWSVHYLGPSTPSKDLVIYAKETSPDVMVISTSTKKTIDHVKKCVGELSRISGSPLILVGGSQVHFDDMAGILATNDLKSGIMLLESHFKTGPSHQSLNDILSGIGKNIQEMRKLRGLNQGQLANAAGVDRAYISLIENGKQNLTVAGLVKLSDALGVSLAGIIPADNDLSRR